MFTLSNAAQRVATALQRVQPHEELACVYVRQLDAVTCAHQHTGDDTNGEVAAEGDESRHFCFVFSLSHRFLNFTL